jgi:hypothetical protein
MDGGTAAPAAGGAQSAQQPAAQQSGAGQGDKAAQVKVP